MSGKNLPSPPKRESIALGAMLGALCGDASGSTVEFLVRPLPVIATWLNRAPQPQPTDAQVQVREWVAGWLGPRSPLCRCFRLLTLS
jgi:hypothetical protein